jgi:glycosyltransferase involved in cell wall biosynthesis
MAPPQESSLRIGYLIQNGAPDLSQVSGPQLHTLATIEGLRKLGHQVRTVATQNSQLMWSDDLQKWHSPSCGLTRNRVFRFFESGIRRVQTELQLPYWGFFDSLHYADAFYQHLKDYDILYERHGYMGFAGIIAARRLNIPLVLELNGNIIKEIDEHGLDISPLQKIISRWITIRTFLAANHIVVVSNALKRILVDEYRVPAQKITVVLNGANVELFSKAHDSAKLRDQFGLSNEPAIVFVGSFQPWHGVDLLLESYCEVVKTNPASQLLLVGDGPGCEKALQQVHYLGLDGKVKFLGRLAQEQVAAILNIAKIVAAPYPFDHCDIVGTPLKLIEYMASGRGIVASTASIHEIIEDGVTGLRVAPANVQALAEGISRLLLDEALCEALGQNAALQAQRFSWDKVNSEICNIFLAEIRKFHRSN